MASDQEHTTLNYADANSVRLERENQQLRDELAKAHRINNEVAMLQARIAELEAWLARDVDLLESCVDYLPVASDIERDVVSAIQKHYEEINL